MCGSLGCSHRSARFYTVDRLNGSCSFARCKALVCVMRIDDDVQARRRGDRVGRRQDRHGGLGFGKLWLVSKMRNIRRTSEPFVPSDPQYNPDDSAMLEI